VYSSEQSNTACIARFLCLVEVFLVVLRQLFLFIGLYNASFMYVDRCTRNLLMMMRFDDDDDFCAYDSLETNVIMF